MGFSGGGTSAVTAHVHTNEAGQGGALSDATLLNTPTLTSQINLERLDTHLAAGNENTYTFTPATALDLLADYSEIMVVISGSADGALDLEMVLNADVTGYFQETFSQIGAVLAGVTGGSIAHVVILSSSVITGTRRFYARIHITIEDSTDRFQIIAQGGAHNVGQEQVVAEQNTAATELTSLNFQTSANNWIAGTRIDTYGVRRQ